MQQALLNVFGGKTTTYSRLAERALQEIVRFFPQAGKPWTAGVALPGGDFPVDGVPALAKKLKVEFPFLTDRWLARLVKAYGLDVSVVLGGAKTASDLGQNFGVDLTEREVIWLIDNEFAQCAEDIVWRRSKLGLWLTKTEIDVLDEWMAQAMADLLAQHAVQTVERRA